MEERELVTTENTTDVSTTEERSSGMGTGLAMLLGCGLTLAAIAGGKAIKKTIAKRKAGREQADSDEIVDVDYEEKSDSDSDAK